MALPGITEARRDHRAATESAAQAERDLDAAIERIAAAHGAPVHVVGSLTWEERNEVMSLASDLTLREAEVRRLAEIIAFMEET